MMNAFCKSFMLMRTRVSKTLKGNFIDGVAALMDPLPKGRMLPLKRKDSVPIWGTGLGSKNVPRGALIVYPLPPHLIQVISSLILSALLHLCEIIFADMIWAVLPLDSWFEPGYLCNMVGQALRNLHAG
jgi:hypothetical protein